MDSPYPNKKAPRLAKAQQEATKNSIGLSETQRYSRRMQPATHVHPNVMLIASIEEGHRRAQGKGINAVKLYSVGTVIVVQGAKGSLRIEATQLLFMRHRNEDYKDYKHYTILHADALSTPLIRDSDRRTWIGQDLGRMLPRQCLPAIEFTSNAPRVLASHRQTRDELVLP